MCYHIFMNSFFYLICSASENGSANASLLIKTAAIILALLVIFCLILIIAKKLKQPKYFKKPYLTPTEIKYYEVLSRIIGNGYYIYPQINLAAVIDKKGGNGRTELFRNADFGVFDFDFNLLLLIEINDASHLRKDRIERDEKVARICKKAGVPLVTFWTKDKIVPEKMQREIRRYLRISNG